MGTAHVFKGCFQISIHALRGEGDGGVGFAPPLPRGISIHALRGEGDHDF